MQPKIEGNIPIALFQEGAQFVAYTPVLDLSACGATETEALKNMKKSIDIFLKEIIKMGTYEDVLTECGWEFSKVPSPHWKPPRFIRNISFDFAA